MAALSPSSARQVIRDFLTSHPGATKDRIYDELVSRMVQAGKMEAHDFNALLRSVAEEVQEPIKENLFDYKEPDLFGSHVSSRWYLKETADELDMAEQEKEDAAAAASKRSWYAPPQTPRRRGRPLQRSLRAVSSRSPTSRGGSWPTGSPNTSSRRRTAPGVPPPTIRARAEGRPSSDRHPAPNQAIRQRPDRRRARAGQGPPRQRRGSADWLRQCRRAGLYEQGKAIYEKGGLNLANLNDEQQIEAEDDYRICVRRGAAAEAKTRRRRKMGGPESDRMRSPIEHLKWEDSLMSKTIHAIYENGVFRPTEAVEIPEKSEVEFEVRLIKKGPEITSLDVVYAILGERFNSGT